MINVAEILKDCPQNMELDCPVFENLEFYKIDDDNKTIVCRIKTNMGGYFYQYFTEHGCYTSHEKSKCVIFPKGKNTWKGFVSPCKFKDGDIVAGENCSCSYITIFRKFIDDISFNYYTCLSSFEKFKVNGLSDNKNLRIATEEEKQKLFNAIKANGYKWNAETKTLEKLSRFNAGDVLVSSMGNIVLLSHVDDKQIIYYHCILEPLGGFRIPETSDCGVGKVSNCTLATDKQRDRLFDILKKSGYKYNPQANKLEKLIIPNFKVGNKVKFKNSDIGVIKEITDHYYITTTGWKFDIKLQDNWELVPNKFDITTLKEFESRVLVRDYDNRMWIPTFWGKYLGNDSNCCYLTTNGSYKYCIPYEGNEHLLGTTKDCDEYYKNW